MGSWIRLSLLRISDISSDKIATVAGFGLVLEAFGLLEVFDFASSFFFDEFVDGGLLLDSEWSCIGLSIV
jgi:hypothetical protein